MKTPKTLKTESLIQHIRYIIRTGNVESEAPISTMIVAGPAHGKSVNVAKVVPEDIAPGATNVPVNIKSVKVIFINDCTSWGMQNIIKNYWMQNRSFPSHIIIPDMAKIGARNRASRKELMAFFMSMMSEGLKKIKTKEIETDFGEPAKIGLIFCTTPEEIIDGRGFMRRSGFLSRLLPFTYSYKDSDISLIKEAIWNDATLEFTEEVMDPVNDARPEIDKSLIPILMNDADMIFDRVRTFTNMGVRRYKGDDGEMHMEFVRRSDRKTDDPGLRTDQAVKCYVRAMAIDMGKDCVDDEVYSIFRSKIMPYLGFDYAPLV